MENEKRLIDANATLAGIETFMQCYAEKEKALTPFWVKVAIQALDMVRQFIKEMPTVDAVEVVHGRWLFVIKGKQTSIYVCSECNRSVAVTCDEDNIKEQLIKNYPYCHCGAKMDGDGNGKL